MEDELHLNGFRQEQEAAWDRIAAAEAAADAAWERLAESGFSDDCYDDLV